MSEIFHIKCWVIKKAMKSRRGVKEYLESLSRQERYGSVNTVALGTSGPGSNHPATPTRTYKMKSRHKQASRPRTKKQAGASHMSDQPRLADQIFSFIVSLLPCLNCFSLSTFAAFSACCFANGKARQHMRTKLSVCVFHFTMLHNEDL